MSAPWLTIVTVVKDDADGLARTVDSVRRQDLTGIEYIVIDSSVDREVVATALERANVPARITWTEPAGIYPAMNVGLAQATGTYVYFANAGDALADEAIADIRRTVDANEPEWLFGDVEIVGRDGTRTVTPGWDYEHERATAFSRGHFPPHQGTVVKTILLRDAGGFDTSYFIAADYAAFLRYSHIRPVFMDRVLAVFHEGGASTAQWRHSVQEFHRARREILKPRGAAAIAERANTAKQYFTLGAYRIMQRVGLR